jgi:hypothetical protein
MSQRRFQTVPTVETQQRDRLAGKPSRFASRIMNAASTLYTLVVGGIAAALLTAGSAIFIVLFIVLPLLVGIAIVVWAIRILFG